MNFLRLVAEHTPRSIRRGGRRAIVTVLCVAIGVAAVVALQVASLSIGDVLTANVRAANGGDVALTSNAAPLSQADLQAFADLRARGGVRAWTAVGRVHVTAPGSDGRLVPFEVNTVTVGEYPLGGEPTFTAPSGATVAGLLKGHGDVIVTAVLADELGAGVGTRLTVTGVGRPGYAVTVRGIVQQATLEHSAVMVVPAQDQSLLTDASPQYVAVYANLDGNATTVASTLRQTFPQATVRTVDEAIASAQQEVHDFHTYSLVAGLVALLVAGVGIQNAMQSTLASRVTEVAMLKALGFPPLSVGGLFAVEAAALGLVGGAIGVVVGIVASLGVTSVVARVTAIAASPHVDAATVGEGLLLGAGATVLFALLPLAASIAVRPLGLLRGDLPPARQSAPRWAGVAAVVAALFAVLASAVTGDPLVGSLLVVGGLLACGVLIAVAAGAVALLARLRRPRRTAVGVAGAGLLVALVAVTVATGSAVAPLLLVALVVWTSVALAPARVRVWVLMAARGLDRRRIRTSVTIVALVVGALASGLTMTMAASLRNQISQALSDAGTTNMVAIASDPTRATLLANASRLGGVQASVDTLTATGRALIIDGRPAAQHVAGAAAIGGEEDEPALRQLDGVTGYDLGAGSLPSGFTVVDGRPLTRADAGTMNVMVDQALAAAPASLHPGSTVTMSDTTTGNQVTLHVVGMYKRSTITGRLLRYSPRIEGDVTAARALAGGNAQTVLDLTVAPDQLDAATTTLQRQTPSALVVNVNDLTAVVRTTLNNILLVLTVVTAMVVLAGIAVVANSVTLAMIERAREVALMKAVGFGPRHVLGLVVLEYGLAGFLASAGGVAIIAAILTVLSHAVLQSPISFSLAISAAVVAASVIVTAATAWVAARSAATVRPLAALRNA